MKNIYTILLSAHKKAWATAYILILSIYGHCAQITVPSSTEVLLQASSYFQVWNQQVVQIPTGSSLVVYNFLYVNVGAGDTLLLDANNSIGNNIFTRTQLQIKNIAGTVSNPILIKNKTGKIIQITQTNSNSTYGITFHGCKNIIVSGKEGNTSFNLRVKNFVNTSSMGITFDRNTKNVELAYCEIGYIGSQGVQYKSPEPYNGSNTIADTSYCREYVQLGGLGVGKFHDNYIHHTGSEGIYIGSTAYNQFDGTPININQNFANSLPLNSSIFYFNNSWRFIPHFADTILIYNNVTDSTGWDGIQVAMAKYYQVFNNKVNYYGIKKEYNQMYGIIIGSPCVGETYNNTVNTGSGSAIQCFGVKNKFYNNLIIRPNLNSKETVWWAINAIYFNDKICTPQTLNRLGMTYTQTLFEAIHNTIIMNPNDSGRAIMFMQNFPGQTYGKCYNNLAVRDPDPSVINSQNYSLPNAIFIANPQQSNFSNANNFASTDLQTVGFVDVLTNNYDLNYGCVACRNAQALTLPSTDKVWYDQVNKSRIIDSNTNTIILNPSYGCFEVVGPKPLIYLIASPENQVILWPNPIDKAKDKEINISINPDNLNYQSTNAYIELTDTDGFNSILKGSYINGVFNSNNIDFSIYKSGVYYAILKIDDILISTQKLMIN